MGQNLLVVRIQFNRISEFDINLQLTLRVGKSIRSAGENRGVIVIFPLKAEYLSRLYTSIIYLL